MSSDSTKAPAVSIDGCCKYLPETPELLGQSRLEIDRELNLGNCRNHVFPVLSGATQKKSGSLITPENIGSETKARNLLTGNVLDGGPELGIDQRSLAEPLGNGLLTERRPVHELGDAIGKRDLTPRDPDGLLKSSNVRFLHDHPKYTTSVVSCNNDRRVPARARLATVLRMPVAHRKRLEKPEIEVVRGPDGHTFGERLRACMEARGRELGRKYTQTDLVRDMNRIVGRTASDEPVITQQAISLILNNERSESGVTAIMAAVFGVEALWLGFGIGPRTYVESALKKAR